MKRYSKLQEKILSGSADGNVDFGEMRQLLIRLGFVERIKSSHHIFARSDIVEIINIQPRGNRAKPYQVRQVRDILVKYKLGDSRADQV